MFDLSTGTFTAPLKGVYEFSFTGNSHYENCLSINVYQNDKKIHTIRGKYCGPGFDKFDFANLASTWLLQLEAGDKITLKVSYGELFSGANEYRIFNGILLKLL